MTDVVHGTTVATNAVLERRGAVTALVTTAGFRDVLELRRLRIPHMYDPFWRKPEPLVPRRRRYEVNERVTADGTVLRPLDADEARAVAARLAADGVESVAVCLLHSYRFPAHEQELGEILRAELPGVAGVALERDPARAARVRALRDDGRQRLRPSADARLHRGHPRRARRRRRSPRRSRSCSRPAA